ncbi:MAG: AfsR/SARP family transcriptional regulator [Bacteroidota bacterium]
MPKDAAAATIVYAAKTCRLAPAAYTTDRHRFLSLIDGNPGGNQAPPEDTAALEEALALYRGEYLSELDYPWVVQEREHLGRLYLEAAIRLARLYLQNRQEIKTVRVLAPLAEKNPLREEIAGLLMSAYAGLGDRPAVVALYQQLKLNLDRELGLEPAPEITRLYYQLCGSRASDTA